jgi:polyisoprenoid-binding protein YceI
MHDDVLESGKFPEFTFESSAIDAEREKQDMYRLNITGGLTLHGVTNPQSFFAQNSLRRRQLSSIWRVHDPSERLWAQNRLHC